MKEFRNHEFQESFLRGMSQSPKRFEPRFLYDEEGSRLFEKICQTPEYYVTRTELEILKSAAPEIAVRISRAVELLELGGGAGVKTRILMRRLRSVSRYLGVEISESAAEGSRALLHGEFPNLTIDFIHNDFNRAETWAAVRRTIRGGEATAAFFPGSTLGNFDPPSAIFLLRRIREALGEGSALLLGLDLVKDKRTLEAAYNDLDGVTARFNLNLLCRANRELGANFDLGRFCHEAVFNTSESRIEMNLVSTEDQFVSVDGREFHLKGGERMQVERSYKFTTDSIQTLALESGYAIERIWTDAKTSFAVVLLRGRALASRDSAVS